MRREVSPRKAASFALVFACALTLAACDAPAVVEPVVSYDPTSLTGGVAYRWSLGRTVRVFADATGAPDGADLPGAVARAVRAWRDVPAFGEYSLVVTTSLADADVVVYHAGNAPPLAPPCPLPIASASGVTHFCRANVTPDSALTIGAASGGRAKVLIRVDATRSGSRFDAVVAHELGHALGIGGHSADPDDLMFGIPAVGAPSANDVRVLRRVLSAIPDLRL